MQTVRCAACGRRYDYRREGCCPHCGAYNRPPRREWVEADGSIHHGEDRTQARPRPGKVCYEEKVCYEGKKQCFEEQARRPRSSYSAAQFAKNSERVVKSFQKQFNTRYAKGKAQNNGVAALVFTIILVIAIMVINGGVLGSKGWSSDGWNNGGWSTTPATPGYNYEKTIDASCGDAVWINDDLAMQFLGYLKDEEGGSVYLFYLASDYDLAVELLSDGFITIEEPDGTTYVVTDVGYDWIRFDAPIEDVAWQTLHIDSYEGEITIRGLYPVDDSMMDQVWIVPDEDAAVWSLEQA